MGSSPGRGDSSAAPDALSELMNAERALEGLVDVTRQRKMITAAFKRATSRERPASEGASSAELAWRRHISDDLESIAKRSRELTPAFAAAIDEVDGALRAVIARSAAGGLRPEEQAEIDELYAALGHFAAEIQGVPAHQPSGRNAAALRGLGLRRARRALGSIEAEMDAQWQKMQMLCQWDLVQPPPKGNV